MFDENSEPFPFIKKKSQTNKKSSTMFISVFLLYSTNVIGSVAFVDSLWDYAMLRLRETGLKALFQFKMHSMERWTMRI